MATEPNVARAQIKDDISALRTERVAGYMLPPGRKDFRRKDSANTDAQEGTRDVRDLEINPEWLAGRRPRAASNYAVLAKSILVHAYRPRKIQSHHLREP